MPCPATIRGFIDCLDSLGRRRGEVTSAFSAPSLPIQNNSIPRPPRDFYFHFRVIEPVSRLSRAGLALLSRSCP